ncbi:hypothetical protein [Flavilitoribacter nigricans]|uniref:DUF4407 domain-containing protein n=1 Tax=Flavilitoribacter nigricans (strain ATCC 23147 / DSM 23189 / NBRC 102662 / NCIMB 1420 / SS-2) TaxID=1122177 RepID=A0A2D0NBV9_FLAN2|nr:hypothetical protein [Flavilitoribacter nigricans]PHN05866.1 hypothetical protein CRP01_15480 [Flavilitoribacter nigricans DSM 23189 = NBRC 102662]
MKITKTTPENKDFFNEHGSSLGAYGLIGFIGQFLSGASLAYAVYALILAEILKQGMPVATLPLLLFALLVALFIELANRILARRAIKPFVVKGLFKEDPQLAGRHKILNKSYLVGLVAIAALSYFLSAVGSSYYAEDSTEIPDLIKVDSLKEIYADQMRKLETGFSQDSLTLSGPYELRLRATRDRFQSDSLALRKEREKYRTCANAGKQWCKNKMTEYLALIDRARSAMNDSLAVISSLKGNAMMAAVKDRNEKTRTLEKEKAATLFQAEQKNSDRLKEISDDSSFKGIVFIILTIAGQTVFYLMIYLSLQVEAGSDINYEIEPNEFWNLPTVMDEFKVMISWRMERGLRRLIRWLFGEPGEHETDIPYRGLFENTSTFKAASAPRSMPKSTPTASVTFIAQLEHLNLTQCKQRLKMYKKRLGSVTQRKIKLEKAGKTVPKKTLAAIDNNTNWVEAYTARIQELESAIAHKKSKAK